MEIITGANGFIGSAMAWERNKASQKQLVCVDTVLPEQRPQPLANRQIHSFLHKDEIWDFLQSKTAKDQVRWVIHMGACSSTVEMDLDFLEENNVTYTRRIWQWCTENRKPLIYASSGATYGAGEMGFDDATDPEQLKPLNPYGDSKVKFDRWALKQVNTPPIWFGLKFFNVYGPNEYHKGFLRSVVLKAFEQIRQNGSLQLFRSHRPDYKDGQQLRDFVYVKDITRWMQELMQGESRSGIYNMGMGTSRSWLDLAQNVFLNMNQPMKIDWIDIPPEMRERYQYFTEAKMDRFLSLKVSRPQWPLEKGIADYVRNYLLNDEAGL